MNTPGRDANGYSYANEPSGKLQRVLNERWPHHDENGPHARDGITYRHDRPAAVATIHFSSDGTTQVDGWVTRVANGSVYFEAPDDRLVRFGVWLPGEDVKPLREE